MGGSANYSCPFPNKFHSLLFALTIMYILTSHTIYSFYCGRRKNGRGLVRFLLLEVISSNYGQDFFPSTRSTWFGLNWIGPFDRWRPDLGDVTVELIVNLFKKNQEWRSWHFA